MKVNKIDHICIAVKNLDEARKVWEPILGKSKPDDPYVDEPEKIRVARYWLGEVGFELMESTTPDGNVAKFIEAKGEGIHQSGPGTPRLILVEVGEYWLDSARFTIDVDEFNSAMAQAQANSQALTRAEWYESAVRLYQGEYLQNLYYDWVFRERRRLALAYLATLQELATFHMGNRSAREALSYLESALTLDPLNEELYCQAMRACSMLNDRAGIVHRYEQLRRMLGSELNMEPLPSTTSLYQTLSGRVDQ